MPSNDTQDTESVLKFIGWLLMAVFGIIFLFSVERTCPSAQGVLVMFPCSPPVKEALIGFVGALLFLKPSFAVRLIKRARVDETDTRGQVTGETPVLFAKIGLLFGVVALYVIAFRRAMTGELSAALLLFTWFAPALVAMVYFQYKRLGVFDG